MMLPRHGTTESEARSTLEHCGIEPEDIFWAVSANGTFVFGRKSHNSAPLTETQHLCLMRWVEDKRVKVGFIGWEAEAQ
jgi:hypothetical protein